MNTLDGNKLIVEFMGGKQVDSTRIDGKDYEMYDLPVSFPIKLSDPDMFGMKRTGYLGFRSSWDWQIPVWNKFLSLTRDEYYNRTKGGASDNWSEERDILEKNYHSAIDTDSPKEALDILILSIQWYNQNKQ